MPIIDEKGKAKEYFTLRIDITEKKQKEEELLINRQNLRAIFNKSKVESYLLGQNFEIIDANLVAQTEARQLRKKDIGVGDSILEYVHRDYKSIFIKNYQQALLGKEIQYEIEVKYQNTSTWYDISYTPIHNHQQEVYAVLYNRHNITDKKYRVEKIKK